MRRLLLVMLVPMIGLLSLEACKQEPAQPAQPAYPDEATKQAVPPRTTTLERAFFDECYGRCSQGVDRCVRGCDYTIISPDLPDPYRECTNACEESFQACEQGCMEQ